MFGNKYNLVKWYTLKGDRKECWVTESGSQSKETAIPSDLPDPEIAELVDSCNTSKDKRFRRVKIAGVNIVTFPCGQILSVDQLYGSESLSQVLLPVYALMKNPELKSNVKTIIHDNACKFAAFVKKRRAKSDIMEHLATLDYRVDRHHFKNHVGEKCRKLHDPDKCDLLRVSMFENKP